MRQKAVATLKALLLIGAVVYLAIVALMYLTQRALMYFPEILRTAPTQAGLPQAAEVVLDTADGERVIVWHIAPRGDQPVVLYFHGNGGALRYRADRFRALTQDGTGLVTVCEELGDRRGRTFVRDCRIRGAQRQVALHSRSSTMSTASTGPWGGSARYCSYFSASNASARSLSSPPSRTRARPRTRIHHNRRQSSS